MKRKILAAVLTGVLTLGGSFGVFAADAAATDAAATTDASANEELSDEQVAEVLKALGIQDVENMSEEDLTNFLGSLSAEATAEAGDGTETEFSLSDLLASVSGEDGEADLGSLLGGLLGSGSEEINLGSLLGGLFGGSEEGSEEGGLGSVLGGLLGTLGGEDGSFDIGGLVEGLGIGELISSLAGENGSLDLGKVLEGIGLADVLGSVEGGIEELVAGLTGPDGLVPQFLNALSDSDANIAQILGKVKNEDGTYDFEQLATMLESATESEDNSSVTIDGVELTSEDLQNAITTAAEALGLGEAVAEASAEDAA